MKKCLVFILIALLMGAPLTRRLAYADKIDLVKLQKEEEERKKKLKKTGAPGTVITNETLKQYETPKDKEKEAGQEGEEGIVKTDATVQTGQAKPAKIDPIQTQEYWQKLRIEFEQKITDLKAKIDQDQSEYNRLFTQHLMNDLPLEKANLKKQLDNMIASLKNDKETLKRVEEEFELLPEKARKAGVPPGWLR